MYIEVSKDVMVGRSSLGRLKDAARSGVQIRSSYDRQRCPMPMQRSTTTARRVSALREIGAAMLLCIAAISGCSCRHPLLQTRSW